MRRRTKWNKVSLEAACITDKEVEIMIKAIDRRKIVVDEDLNELEKFKEIFTELYGYLKEGFTNEKLRTHTIKFRLTKKGPVHEMEFRRFITNLILWRPIVEFGSVVEERHIVDCDVITSGILKDYINTFYINDFIKDIKYSKLNKVISDTTFALSKIPTDFNIIMGMVVSLESYMGTAKKFPRFEEIMRHQLDINAQPHEIEKIISDLTKEQVQILKQDPDNIVSAMLISKAGVRESALQEFIVASGNKPDLAGNTMPVPIDKNFIMGGLSNIVNYYIDAVAGRKSIILNKTEMGKSGYFAFLVTLLNTGTRLDDSVDDCHSVKYLKMSVKSEAHLKALVGRYYVPSKGRLDIIKPTDTHLIGKVINLRSPATCACKGNRICKTCYGENADIVKSVSVGGLSAIIIMLTVQQNILSSKHILATASNIIKFNQDFDKFFKIYSNEIILGSADEDDESLCIIINGEDLEFSNVFDRDLSSTNIHEFSVGRIKKKRKTGDDEVEAEILYTFREENDSPMTLASDIVSGDKVKESKASNLFYIPLKDVDEEIALFTIEVENNELTKPLYDIKHILDKKDHNGATTIDEVANAFLDATLEAKIPVKSVNVEVLLYPMIRLAKNKFERPNFRKHVFDEDITILTVKSALKNNKSVTVKLCSEALESQLTNLETYEMSGTSYLDNLFREKLLPIMDGAIDTLNNEMIELCN